MDILTTRGQEFVEHEAKAVSFIREACPGSTIYHTPLDKPASLDLVSTRDGVVHSVAEIKSRNNTIAEMQEWGSLILTYTKVDALRCVAMSLHVPAFVVLYLIPEDAVAVARLVHPGGELVAPITKRTTTTQRSCNGGEAVRVNAYIPLALFREIRPTDF